jgi:hypothetical protein
VDDDFDPYRKWLGIPPEEQPPNHYRLLGIAVFEDDPDVIQSAADRQMAHVRTFQTGKRSALSQAILNELSAARLCLLDPQRKLEYDEELRAAVGSPTSAASPLPSTPPSTQPAPVPPAPRPVPTPGLPLAGARPLPTQAFAVSPVAVAPVASAAPTAPAQVRSRPTAEPGPVLGAAVAQSVRRRRASQAPLVGAVAAIGLAGLLVLVVMQFLGDSSEPSDEARSSRPSASKKAKATATTSTRGTGANGEEPKAVPPRAEKPRPKPLPPRRNPAGRPSAPTPDAPRDNAEPFRPSPDRPTTPDDSRPDSLPSKPDAGDRDPSPGPTKPVAGKKAPYPAKSALEKEIRKVKEQYKPTLAAAKTVEERIAVVQEMLAKAEGMAEDAVAQCALLAVAREITVHLIVNAATICEIVDFLAERYEIDALAEKRMSLEQAAALELKPEQYRDLIPHAERLAREALAAGRFEPADALARMARMLAKKLTDPRDKVEFTARVEALVAEVSDHEKELKTYQKMSKQLSAEPDDPGANLAVGRYLCVIRHDWPAGLPHLAKGPADSKLRELAEKDLAVPPDAKAQIELADAWMVLGKRQGNVYKRAYYERAKTWFAKAAALLPEAEKEQLKPKLEEIEQALAPLTIPGERPAERKAPPSTKETPPEERNPFGERDA